MVIVVDTLTLLCLAIKGPATWTTVSIIMIIVSGVRWYENSTQFLGMSVYFQTFTESIDRNDLMLRWDTLMQVAAAELVHCGKSHVLSSFMLASD